MPYNVYEIDLDGDIFEVCAENEHSARILCAHSNRKAVARIQSCRPVGQTDSPYIRLLKKNT